jgi:CRISPR-associated protein Cas5h
MFVDVSESKSEDWFSVSSAVVSETVKELNFITDPNDAFNFLEEDLLPADFVENNSREVGKMVRALFSTRNLPFEVKLSVPHYTLSSDKELQHIVFLE